MNTCKSVGAFALLLVACLFGAPFGIAQTAPQITQENLIKRLQGSWTGIAEEVGGKALTTEEVKTKNRRITVAGTKFTMARVNGNFLGKWEGRIEVKPAAPFPEFNFYGKGHDGKYIERIGICQIDGNTLRICYGRPDHPSHPERPVSFTTVEGAGRESFVFKRDAE